MSNQKTYDSISVDPDGTVNVRHIISENGNVRYVKYSLHPNASTQGQPDHIVALCTETWTDEVINSFIAKVQS
jgi:hypothetical protein